MSILPGRRGWRDKSLSQVWLLLQPWEQKLAVTHSMEVGRLLQWFGCVQQLKDKEGKEAGVEDTCGPWLGKLVEILMLNTWCKAWSTLAVQQLSLPLTRHVIGKIRFTLRHTELEYQLMFLQSCLVHTTTLGLIKAKQRNMWKGQDSSASFGRTMSQKSWRKRTTA